MTKGLVVAILGLLLVQEENPDLKYLKEKGISIQKIAKKEEWQFKDQGKLTRSQIVISHVTEDISIEVYSEELEVDKVNYDPKYSMEQSWKRISADGQFKEPKQAKKLSSTNFPGRAASGVKVWLLDMTMKLADGTAIEWKQHCFIGHENRAGYIVHVITKEGGYAKHKADIDLMLSSIKTYKIPKK